MKFFLQLAGVIAWELVDEFTFSNKSRAVNRRGSQRYRDDEGVIVEQDGRIAIHGIYTPEELAIIVRFTGVEGRAPVKATIGQAFYDEPEFIRFKGKNSVKVHEVKRAA
jgi:hypothetical protein